MEKKKFFYGWYVLIVCITIMALAYSPLVTCASLFVKPITDELGFSRSAYSMVGTIVALTTMVLSPYLGKLMARKNMKRVLTISVAGMAVCYGLYSVCSNIVQFYLVAFCLGIFSCGATLMPVSILMTNWFVKKRGFVLSIAMAGSSVGGVILSPIIGNLIANHGWRWTYVCVAAMMFVVLVPLCVFVVRQKPADKGLEPYGAGEGGKKALGEEWNISLAEAKKLPMFWVFVFGVTAILFTGGVIAHIPAYIVESGYNPALASQVVSLYSAIAIPGKLLLGYLFDRFGSKTGILFGNLTFTLSVIGLLFIQNEAMLYLAMVLYGFGTCIGTVSFSVLTSKIFGSKHYGEIYGFSSFFTRLGSALGSPCIALIYDLSHQSYRPAWVFIAVVAVLMTVALLYVVQESKRHRSQAAAQ